LTRRMLLMNSLTEDDANISVRLVRMPSAERREGW
jgi:hypothetical protein